VICRLRMNEGNLRSIRSMSLRENSRLKRQIKSCLFRLFADDVVLCLFKTRVQFYRPSSEKLKSYRFQWH